MSLYLELSHTLMYHVAVRDAKERAWKFYQDMNATIPEPMRELLNDERAMDPFVSAVFTAAFFKELSEIYRGKKAPDPSTCKGE